MAPRSARLRLGTGETVPAGPNFFARRRFLEAIERRVPKALRQLASIAVLQTNEGNASRAGRLDAPTEAALQQWAEDWGIPLGPAANDRDDGWWMRQVRTHIKHWRAFPDSAGHWQAFVSLYREPAWPTLPPWHAHDESEPDFIARVHAYIAQVKNLPGVSPTPTTFTALDFDALALEHVAQFEPVKIQGMLGTLGSSSIQKRNAELAKVLGLQLRRRRGRPSTKKRKK